MAQVESRGRRLSPAAIAAYVLMLAGAVGVFHVIQRYGETLSAPAASPIESAETPAAAADTHSALFHVLLTLAAVVALGRLMGWLFRLLRQPPVIGEVLAGIMLGPSLLGHIAPAAQAYLLPASAVPTLEVIAQLGVILYMFTVGLEFDAALLRDRGHATLAISHASIVAPFLLGEAAALAVYPALSTDDVSFTIFALFLGAAMSVTAFPVLARILADLGINRTPLGAVALSCAAVDDVTAWCLLAFVVGVAQAQVASALTVVALTLGYIALMFFVARPVLMRFRSRHDRPASRGVTAAVFLALLLSALATELIGIHAIFGAFLLGAIIPHDSPIARDLHRKLEDLVTIVFLPAYFAFTGMRTEIGLVSGWQAWLLCGLLIAVATAGKFGGTVVAGRATGMGWRESAALGTLMNTRGLMGLVVVNIGLDLEIISPAVFAMMVLMSLVTTIAATPLLRVFLRPAELKSAQRVEQGSAGNEKRG
jgi:Kef-type K+ transport system membrane component KefB